MGYGFCMKSGFTTVDTSIFPDRKFSFKCLPRRGCVCGLLLTMADVMPVTCYKPSVENLGLSLLFQWKTLLQAVQEELRQHIDDRFLLI